MWEVLAVDISVFNPCTFACNPKNVHFVNHDSGPKVPAINMCCVQFTRAQMALGQKTCNMVNIKIDGKWFEYPPNIISRFFNSSLYIHTYIHTYIYNIYMYYIYIYIHTQSMFNPKVIRFKSIEIPQWDFSVFPIAPWRFPSWTPA